MKCFSWDEANIYPIGNNYIIENVTDKCHYQEIVSNNNNK